MDLEKVREKLINLEDIIIQGLCQRARFKHNNAIYEHNSKKFLFSNNYEGTYFDFMFKLILHKQILNCSNLLVFNIQIYYLFILLYPYKY